MGVWESACIMMEWMHSKNESLQIEVEEKALIDLNVGRTCSPSICNLIKFESNNNHGFVYVESSSKSNFSYNLNESI